MHAAFSRFIRPGSQIINSTDTNSIAALDSSTGNLILVIRNNAESEVNYSMDLLKFESVGTFAQVYRFQLPGSLKKEAAVAINNKQILFTAPKLSITTCIIPVNPTASINRKFDNKGKDPSFFTLIPDNRLRLSPEQRNPVTISIYNCRGVLVFTTNVPAGELINNTFGGKRMLANELYLVKQSPVNGAEDIYHNK